MRFSCDNKVVHVTNNHVYHKRAKHIEDIHEKVEAKEVATPFDYMQDL